MWIANYNSSCTLHAVGDAIQEWGAAFAFPKGTSDSVLEAWDKDILGLQQDTDLEDVFKVGLPWPATEGSRGMGLLRCLSQRLVCWPRGCRQWQGGLSGAHTLCPRSLNSGQVSWD